MDYKKEGRLWGWGCGELDCFRCGIWVLVVVGRGKRGGGNISWLPNGGEGQCFRFGDLLGRDLGSSSFDNPVENVGCLEVENRLTLLLRW